MKGLHMVTWILLVVGGLILLLDAFGYGLDKYVSSQVEQLVYVLIGLSAIYEVVTHKKNCKLCGSGAGM